jgi:hypothetical protein
MIAGLRFYAGDIIPYTSVTLLPTTKVFSIPNFSDKKCMK